jgi:hypothetical protein
MTPLASTHTLPSTSTIGSTVVPILRGAPGWLFAKAGRSDSLILGSGIGTIGA